MFEDKHVHLLKIHVFADPKETREHKFSLMASWVRIFLPGWNVELKHGYIFVYVVHGVLAHGLVGKTRWKGRVDLVHESSSLLFSDLEKVSTVRVQLLELIIVHSGNYKTARRDTVLLKKYLTKCAKVIATTNFNLEALVDVVTGDAVG